MPQRERFSVGSRAEFDEFWVSGIEHGQMRPAEALDPTTVQGQTTDFSQASWASLDDPPVTAQVWWRYKTSPADGTADLLVDPSSHLGAFGPRASEYVVHPDAALRLIHQYVIGDDATLEDTQLAQSFGVIAIALTYEQMVTRLLPLTEWRHFLIEARNLSRTEKSAAMSAYLRRSTTAPDYGRIGWFLHLLAVCDPEIGEITYGAKSRALARVHDLVDSTNIPEGGKFIGRVSLNRPVKASVERSRRTVKADAVTSLFNVRCDGIRWAVLDTGIDARHDWFRATNPRTAKIWPDPFDNNDELFNYTRVVETYDFTRQRASGGEASRSSRDESTARPSAGRFELPGDVPITSSAGERFYEPPSNGHGTHVAGILGGTGGICPDIKLYDYRVLDEKGHGSEFAVVSALRHILEQTQSATRSDPTGRSRDLPIHGVNLSLSLDADVTSDACGWSLVCRVCDELIRAGVVVVVAAGNTGFEDRTGLQVSTGQDYRTVSITDPGNTERVITVGSTDADRPREYGVSYFSGRGPTADGRRKPDLVAPGNSITSSYGYVRGADDRRNVAATLTGTSMAAAHVSGCAALLMARHRELIGKPEEVKQVLMTTATDLNRDVNFQGAGLVDAVRAVQSV